MKKILCRIQSFFHLWFSQYWGDFKSSATRRIMIDFLERIACFEHVSDISEHLLPLAQREPEINDKDTWGMSDEEPEKPKKPESSDDDDSFDWINREHVMKKKPTMTSRLLSSSLRRTASTNSHPRLPVSFRSIISLTSHDHPNNRRNSSPACSDTGRKSFTYCPAIFGGGLIKVEEPTLFSSHDAFEAVTRFSPTEIAEQFTFIEAEIFQKIQARDFLRHLWIQKKHHSGPNKNPVLASIEHFNYISGWISFMIINQSLLEKRVIVFEVCLKIAVVKKRRCCRMIKVILY